MLDILAHSDTSGCRFCGALVPHGGCVEARISNHGEVKATDFSSSDHENYRDGNIACLMCCHSWDSLSRKLSRDISTEEFLVWGISQVAKKTKTGLRLKNGSTTPYGQFSVLGDIYGDLFQVMFDEAGKDLNVRCPECGEDCLIQK